MTSQKELLGAVLKSRGIGLPAFQQPPAKALSKSLASFLSPTTLIIAGVGLVTYFLFLKKKRKRRH